MPDILENAGATWNPEAVLSPCTGVCEIDPRGFCYGCERTGDEIGSWGSIDNAERMRLMLHVLPRRADFRTAQREAADRVASLRVVGNIT